MGGKHLGVGITLPVRSLAAVSSLAEGCVRTFMMRLRAETFSALGGAGTGGRSRLSRTGLVRFSGGREYCMISGTGTGDPKLTLE